MATDAEVAVLRLNINEPTDQDFDDGWLADLIDETGSVDAASASVWEKKAARYADLVDTSEAGASHKFSDLHKNALAMQTHYQAKVDLINAELIARSRPRANRIVRP